MGVSSPVLGPTRCMPRPHASTGSRHAPALGACPDGGVCRRGPHPTSPASDPAPCAGAPPPHHHADAAWRGAAWGRECTRGARPGGVAPERGAQRSDLRSLPGATDADAPRCDRVMRRQGAIANRGPGGLEVALGEEGPRARQGASAPPLAWRRQLALHGWRQAPSCTGGLAATQKRAGWEHDAWRKILAHTWGDCPGREQGGRG
jgi:hypothetical protein